MTEQCTEEKRLESIEKDIAGHRLSLYGSEGRTGVVACQKTKMDRTAFWKILSVIAIPLLAAMAILYGISLSNASEKEVARIDKSVAVITEKVDELKSTVQKHIEKSDEIINELQEYTAKRMDQLQEVLTQHLIETGPN